MALTQKQIINNLQYALADMAGKAKTLEDQNRALVARNTELSVEVQRIPSRVDNSPKLTSADVRRMRDEYRRTSMSQRELADVYDVNPATVSRIVRGKYHADVR